MFRTLSTYIAIVVLLVSLQWGCNSPRSIAPVVQPTVSASTDENQSAPGEAGQGKASFTDVAREAGLNYRWKISGSPPFNLLQTVGNGCAFLDYDRDQNLDILLVGPKLALYRGNGKGHFADVSQLIKLATTSRQFLGCAVGDYDNDGYSDIYISGYRTGALLHNEQGKTFRDVARSAGIAAQPWSTSCAFADVDNDGLLDLYVSNYVEFGPETPSLCDYGNQILSACAPFNYLPERGVLYRNRGKGVFQDVTKVRAAHNTTGKTLGVAFADIDGSGRQSLALANDGVPGDLLLNRGPRFENIGILSGTAYDANGKTHAGMGLDWGDYDNDGKLDLTVAAFDHEPTCIYRNQGKNFFVENAAPLGVASATMNLLTFGTKWLDYDNDGWLDLVMANGHVRDNTEKLDSNSSYRQPSLLLQNRDGKKFEVVNSEALGHKIVGRGLATGDYDKDGQVDLLIVDSEGAPLLLHNSSASRANWLQFRLIGTRSNRDGIGAMITVEAGGQKQVRRCGTDGSYLSASDSVVHFGLGKYSTASTVSVRWPSGIITQMRNVRAGQIVSIKEGSAPSSSGAD